MRFSLKASVVVFILGFSASLVHSQTGVDPAGPCPYKPIDLSKPGVSGQPFQNPPTIRSQNGFLRSPLVVKYTDPATTKIADCPLTLRSFNGALVGPTLRLRPGDAIQLHLENQLPKESDQEIEKQYQDEASQAHIVTRPHSFNTTNLHYHGLHVSPSGNSDNVLLAIRPGETEDYDVKIPSDHPSGTFWYHPHAHGSTAIQVGSGMAGALIIEDDTAKIPASLREASSPEHEKIIEFESILYNKNGKVDNIESFFPSPSIPTETNCNQFSGPLPHQTSEGTWQCSHRMTTVNGQLIPVITMQPGEVARWRFIDTSFRESIQLRLDDHILHEIALDGLYTGTIDDWGPDNPPLDLEPGYRSDVLVQAKPCTGEIHGRRQEILLLHKIPLLAAANGKGNCRYGLWNMAIPPSQSLLGGQQHENLLAILEVDGPPVDMTLPTPAEMKPLAPFANEGDLSKKRGADGGPIGVQEVVFKLGSDLRNPLPNCDPSGHCPPDKTCADNKEGCPTNYFQVNYQSYDPNNERRLKLGATERWVITTVGDPAGVPEGGVPPLPHVFHIHVNPFQFTRQGPAGSPELVWKDTLLIPPAAKINIFTTYKDFTGKFVLHCHILDHEDLGMMEVENVVNDLSTPMPEEKMGLGVMK